MSCQKLHSAMCVRNWLMQTVSQFIDFISLKWTVSDGRRGRMLSWYVHNISQSFESRTREEYCQHQKMKFVKRMQRSVHYIYATQLNQENCKTHFKSTECRHRLHVNSTRRNAGSFEIKNNTSPHDKKGSYLGNQLAKYNKERLQLIIIALLCRRESPPRPMEIIITYSFNHDH